MHRVHTTSPRKLVISPLEKALSRRFFRIRVPKFGETTDSEYRFGIMTRSIGGALLDIKSEIRLPLCIRAINLRFGHLAVVNTWRNDHDDMHKVDCSRRVRMTSSGPRS
jgi:hypothetical protein